MDTRDIYKLVRELSEERDDVINLYDSMDIELNDDFVIETGVVGFTEDGVIVHLDEDAMEFLDFNGVLLESEEQINEDQDSIDAVESAVLNRISRQHTDLLSKYGPAAVMAAVRDVAEFAGGDGLDEIGSSDVSIWVRQVVQDLEAGHYKNLHENDDHVDVDAELAEIVKSEDPFELVYRYISGDGGEEMRKVLQDMYDDIVIDSQGRLHPDDDFETIIDRILDRLESDYGINETYGDREEAHPVSSAIYRRIVNSHPELLRQFTVREISDACNDYAYGIGDVEDIGSSDVSIWTKEVIDDLQSRNKELAEIKKLALGHEEVDEGLGKALLGGAALIAAITGINKMEANRLMQSEPQLIELAKMRQEAFIQNDDAKVEELDRRIEKTMDHIRVTGRPVMGPDGTPVNPREPVGEAEYQGRKVPLNKPMAGDVKKSKVYVKKPNGKVVKVNFGDKNMRIKKSNPNRRKSFRARHNCDNPGPKWKARYWSCRAW